MESLKHKDLKYDIYWNAICKDTFASLETTIGNTRTDVFIESDLPPIAIEIQYSPLSIATILHRMREHTKKNIYTLWLLTEELLVTNNRVRNLKCTRFLQELQNGVLFIIKNQDIIPARIDNSLIFLHKRIKTDTKKFLDLQKPITYDDLKFIKNDIYGVNITTIDEWWLSSYVEYMELYS